MKSYESGVYTVPSSDESESDDDSFVEVEELEPEPEYTRRSRVVAARPQTEIETIMSVEILESMRKVLTADMWSRKVRYWPLVFQIPDVKIPLTPTPPLDQDVYVDMWTDFEFLKMIILRHQGKLCVAGGAVANHLHLQPKVKERNVRSPTESRDADLFFYGVSEVEANLILKDCIALLCSTPEYVGYDEDNKHENTLKPNQIYYVHSRIERNEKYVNVHFARKCYNHIGGYNMTYRVYQFVLRIYPTLDSIIGAFDVPYCSVLWDGVNFYGTEIATWCAKSGILVANISRRSPSFSYRLVKYCKRFNLKLYFPGLSQDFYKMADIAPNFEELKAKIMNAFKETKFRIGGHRYDDMTSDSWLEDEVAEIAYSSNYPQFQRIVFSPNFTVEMSRRFNQDLHRMTKEVIERVSDYSHTHMGNGSVRTANTIACGVGNTSAVICCMSFKASIDYDDVMDIFNEMERKPVITVLTNEHLYNRYQVMKKRLEKVPLWVPIINRIKYLGVTNDKVEQDDYVDYVYKHNANVKIAARNLKGTKWNTQNPDIQWTASHHPIHSSAKEYYGDHHIPFFVGIPSDIVVTLLAGRSDQNCSISRLNNDAFRYLMCCLLRTYSC